jgi:hypothetical protein
LLGVFLIALLLPDGYIDQMQTALPKPIRDYVHEHHSSSSTVAAASRPSRARVFAIGATTGDVLTIQGPPTSRQGNVWYYGTSRVIFDNGQVSGWVESPGDLLHVAWFTVGATKDQVRAIQGSPTSTAATVWVYGKSRVTFDNDRVTAWVNVPSDPLHVR